MMVRLCQQLLPLLMPLAGCSSRLGIGGVSSRSDVVLQLCCVIQDAVINLIDEYTIWVIFPNRCERADTHTQANRVAGKCVPEMTNFMTSARDVESKLNRALYTFVALM